jgi:hypothetical protein
VSLFGLAHAIPNSTRRTYGLRRSEAIECNEAGEPFSTACKDFTLKINFMPIRKLAATR